MKYSLCFTVIELIAILTILKLQDVVCNRHSAVLAKKDLTLQQPIDELLQGLAFIMALHFFCCHTHSQIAMS